MSARPRWRLPAAVLGIALLSPAAPAFAQGATPMVSEIDFNSAEFEVAVGPTATVSPEDFAVCMAISAGEGTSCSSSEPTTWLANTYVRYVSDNANSRSGSFYIENRSTGVIVSFVQWGAGNQPRAADAVTAGVWSHVDRHIAKPNTAGHSMQLRGGTTSSRLRPGDWVAAPATIGSR